VTGSLDGWEVVAAPTYRVDLLREVDLVEEIGRHFGFDNLPSTFPVATAPAPPPDPPDWARQADPPRADRRRLIGSGHVRIH